MKSEKLRSACSVGETFDHFNTLGFKLRICAGKLRQYAFELT